MCAHECSLSSPPALFLSGEFCARFPQNGIQVKGTRSGRIEEDPAHITDSYVQVIRTRQKGT